MDSQTVAIGGLAAIVAALSIKPIANAVSKSFANYMHQVQEAYKGYGIAAQITTPSSLEIKSYTPTTPTINNYYKRTKQTLRIPRAN